jgi:hypothetical protein|tara:strand:+ start:4808 stop:7687 length:2880 start_codon:yes stop_codon:yes gene_type:complete
MAENLCQDAIPAGYRGDGLTTKYSFAFQYIKTEDIFVYLWNDLTKKYDLCTEVADSNSCTSSPTEYYFTSSEPVELEFCVAPGLPPDDRSSTFDNVIITRATDICNMIARFFPGTSIRAQDLNNDFTQLLLALQEVPERIERSIRETTINVDQIEPLLKEVDMDSPTVWDDTTLPTSGATKRYFETLYQSDPPDPNKRYERGKLWYQRFTTNLGKEVQTFSIYDGTTWQAITSGEIVPNPFTPQSVLYVDPQGDDNNPGRRPDEAFRTIKRAVEVANTPTPGTVSAVSTATYDEVSGFVNITTTANHDLTSGVTVTLSPMIWSCTDGQANFPAVNKQFRVSSVTSLTTFRVYAGPTEKAHTYVSGGVVTPKDARLGDAYTIRCAPGVYAEKFPIQIQAKNLAIIGSSLRNTYIHPDITGESVAGQQEGQDIYPGELKIMFEMDSGSYLTGFTFAGLKSLGNRGNGGVDPDPVYGLPPQQGWVAAHREGSFITKSPYIQNCTHFSDLQTNNASFDPNFLAGEGGDTTSGPSGGGILVDGERVDVSSPLRSFVVDSFTQIALGGPGVLATNNGYAQLVSFFGTFCQYHAKSVNGGQLNLSNCTTDFGQYGLIADGKSPASIFTAAVKEYTAAGSQFIEVISFTKGTQWEPPRQMTPLDHMVVEINGVLYPILGSNETADGYEINIFSPLADTVADPDAFENGGLKIDALEGNTCKFYLQSYISTGGHTMEFVGSGTDYRAHPDFGGVPEPDNQAIEIGGVGDAGSRLSYINGGRVWLSSTDENGNFKVGETFTVNQKTGTIFILPEAIQSRFIIREDLDLRGFKIIQDPSTAGANTDIQLQPSGTGDVVFGTDDVDADGNRIQPAAILEPILEHTTDDDRNWPVVTQKDLGYDADEIPVSGLLGKLAFTDIPSVVGVSNAVPGPNELSFSVSGTTLTITYQPPDGSPALETTLTLSLPSVP